MSHRDPTLGVSARVEALIAEMTIGEKAAQLVGAFPADMDMDDLSSSIPEGLGHICMGGNLASEPGALADALNHIQHFLVEETRLGIPAMAHNEALNGLAQDAATNFPTAIGLGATFRPDRIRAMAEVASREARAVGLHHVLSPVMDVARDARWGRIHETYGEDPHLVAAMSVAFVQGMQGEDLAEGTIATGKHFLGYSLTEGALNQTRTTAGPRQLYEVFALPFEAAIRDAGLASVMNSYSEIDGEPVAASHAILTDLLRDRLGFAGAVVADYSAVTRIRDPHAVAGTDRDAGRMALTAGLDVELPSAIGFKKIPQMVATGELDEAIVDVALRRVLTHKFAVGLIDRPYADAEAAPSVFAVPASLELARRITDESLVLLENDGILPLSTSIGSVAVVGPMVDNLRALFATYTPASGAELFRAMMAGLGGTMAGVSDEEPSASVDPTLDAVTQVFHSTAEVVARDELDDAIRNLYPRISTIGNAISERVFATVVEGCDWTNADRSNIDAAVDAASSADAAVLCIGEKTGWVGDATGGEGRDRSTLHLPGAQAELARRVIATGTPCVVVLLSGRPLDVAADIAGAAAVLQAWHPGADAAPAITDALFGVTNPGGKLPISYPASTGACPTYHGHTHGSGYSSDRAYIDGPSDPVWAFGHGLSYTTFDISDLTISANELTCGESVTIGVTVTNTGDRAGDEVVQVYVRDMVGSVVRPVRQLAGFRRVTLDPGDKARVEFDYDTHQLAMLGADNRLIVEAGEVAVMAGSSSNDLPLAGSFTMRDTIQLEHRTSFVTPSTVA
ncbi:MAG: glycoside hydrolase family 3 N-terminal domain-containing protein [Acidimicrobiales bacterium]|nr:glycoside hydrolase family 3 N-terminal domain-containing protein [Acidimicrobiales bacterium]